MSASVNPRLKGILEALKTLRAAAAEESHEDWPPQAFTGWVNTIGDILEDDLAHLILAEDEIYGAHLLTPIEMPIAYLEPIVGSAS